jgi:predicted MFS family arabinose efflux permease
VEWLVRLLGGRARARVVLCLSSVLALSTADGGMLGALAAQLEQAFGLAHARFGIVVGAASATGAFAAPIAGLLADRRSRVRILAVAIGVGASSMAVSGLATGYWFLFFSRLALGAALAASVPFVTSLVGDFFPPAERARAYGVILTGELIGSGVGLLTGAVLGTLISWRAPFFAFAGGGLLLATLLPRVLKEPQRGGASWITDESSTNRPHKDQGVEASDLFAGVGIRPAQSRVLHTPAERLSLRQTARYLLSIPSFRRLVIASVVGYFFFAGLRTFVVVFALRYYGLGEKSLVLPLLVIGAAATFGTVSGGRLADALLRRGKHTIRLTVAATGYVIAAIGFAPGFLTPAVPLAVAFFSLGGIGLGAANPPLDAARLDIVPSRLWGRGESVRTLTRLVAEAIAPVVFGVTADHLGGRGSSGTGLRNAFLIMLVPLVVAGAIVAFGRRTYPTDTVTAAASDRRQAS